MDPLLVIDRLNDELAVCEDARGNTVTLAASLVPVGAHEGDALMYIDGRFTVAEGYAAAKKASARSRLDALVGRRRESQ